MAVGKSSKALLAAAPSTESQWKRTHFCEYNWYSDSKIVAASCSTVDCKVSRIALPIVSVIVIAAKEWAGIRTFALLDTGSSSTVCTQSLADQLGVEDIAEKLYLTTLDMADENKLIQKLSI